MTVTEDRAAMSSATINDLPDSAFAYIEPGGTKDSGGKTTPRSKRHFPVHDAAHTRNALARLSSSPFGPKAKAKVLAAASKFGIHVGDGDADDRSRQRPDFELLRRRRNSMVRQAERRGMLLEMRARPDGTGGTDFVFEGYGAVFDAPFGMWDKWGDPYTEVVRPGAFTRSLARPDLDVPFLIGHDDKRLALARTRNGTMQLSQDSYGLLVHAVMDGRRSDVRDLAYAVERGDNDEMSIGFVTLGQEWSADYETRSMLDLDLHRGDVSSVPLAANPAAAGASIVEVTSRRPPAAEARGNPVDADLGDAPDYNPQGDVASHGPVAGMHAHAHAPYGAPDGDGHGHPHRHGRDGVPDARHDHRHLFDEDGMIRLDDSGIPVEVTGTPAASLAAARAQLETRRRQLEILALRREA